MYEQEFNSHPRPQFLTQTGTRHHSGKAEDCQSDGHPDLEGRTGTENRQRDSESVGGEEVSIHFVHQSGYFIQT